MLDKSLEQNIDNEITQPHKLGIKLVVAALLIGALISISLCIYKSPGIHHDAITANQHVNKNCTTTNDFAWLTAAVYAGTFTALGLLYPFLIRYQSRLKNMILSNIMARVETLITLGNAIAKKDKSTNLHNYRVTIYSIALAKELNISKVYIEKLIIGSFLHDLGKIAIPDNVLLKNGPLTEEEMIVMKTHVTEGAAILGDGEISKLASDVILFHHEKYSGSGYPFHISGENIPKVSRIFSIVDVFDALTSERTYKPALSLEDSLTIMKSESGKSFDPYYLAAFLRIATELYVSYARKPESYLHSELEKTVKPIFLR